MKLTQFSYSERGETGEPWEIERLDFGQFNLVVGRNATGKTRLLKAIARVAGQFSAEVGSSDQVEFELKVEGSPEDFAGQPLPPRTTEAGPAEAAWGRRAQYFPFAGRMNFKAEGAGETLVRLTLAEAYQRGCNVWGDPFRERILQRMNAVGYALEEVELIETEAALRLAVKESKRTTRTPVRRLSQGQQRALTLLTFLTLLEADQKAATVLIDDFAEGLDFEHAALFTEHLLNHSAQVPLQFIIATNDRYVMNTVPLDHWSILAEQGATIRVFNQANSREKFDNFKFTGLNNFDFFSMDFADPIA